MIIHIDEVQPGISVPVYDAQDQFRVTGISMASDIYHFFVLGTFKLFSTSCFGICD